MTRKLRTHDSKGNFPEVQTIIEFSITSFTTPTEAAEAQMVEAVDQGNIDFAHMKPVPSALDTEGLVAGAIPVIDDIDTVTAAWQPLLEKITRYTKIVDGISEV